MKISKGDRAFRKYSRRCIGRRYNFKNKDVSLDELDMDGRFPEDGYWANKEVTQICRVESGLGKIVIDNEVYTLTKGDAVVIEPHQEFYCEGKLKLIIVSAPAWSSRQLEEIR